MNIKAQDRIGEKHNKLTITDTWRENGQTMCKCVCECTGDWIGQLASVITGNTRSCGCIRNSPELQSNHKWCCEYCGKKHYAKGLCKSCYYRLRRQGSLEYRRNGTGEYKDERMEIGVPEVNAE